MLAQHKNSHRVTSHHPLQWMIHNDHTKDNTEQLELTLRVSSDLNPGIRHRDEPNEDCISVTHGYIPSTLGQPAPFALFVVADGMGGQENGEVASQLAVQTLVTHVFTSLHSGEMTPDTFLPLLKEGIDDANLAVYQRNQMQLTRMGTTLTAALVIGSTAYIAHVGDSRCYLLHESEGLSQITQDHSLVAALASAHMIKPEEVYTHPRRNVIYRCLGEKNNVQVDTCTVPLIADDTLLLCSDGLWEMVRDPQIEAILSSPVPHPSHHAHALIQAALAGGGEDNISAIVVQVLCLNDNEQARETGRQHTGEKRFRDLFDHHRLKI